jgi:AsmA family protein
MILMRSQRAPMTVPAAFPGSQAGRVWLRVLVGTGIAVVVLFAGAFMALSFVDWNRYIELAAAEVKAATGRELKVAGPTKVGLLPLRLIVNDVSLANASWGSRAQLITAKHVEVRVALLPLVIGDVRLKVDVVEPDVYLETDAKGVGNWVMARAGEKKPADTTSESSGLPVDLSAARITRGVVQFRSGRSGKTRRLTLDEAFIRSAGLSGREILIKATIDGVPLSLTGTTDDRIIDALSSGSPLGVKLEARIASATLAASGKVGFPASGARLALKVRADVGDTASLARVAGERIPRLPPIKLDGEINGEKRVYTVKGISLSVGKSTASGAVKADFSGGRPKITADIAAPLVDVQKLRGPGAAQTSVAGKASGSVFSKNPLPLGALNAVDADLDLKIDRLVLPPTILLEAVRGRITLNRGKLGTQSLEMRMGGGDVKLAGALDASDAKHARFSVSVSGSKIELGKMMAALGQGDVLTGGPTELKLDLRSVGASSAALAAALEGHVKLVTGPTRARNRVLDSAGLNIVAQVLNAVNPTRRTEQYSQVECAVINVPVTKGVVTVDRTVAIETNNVGVAMAGAINLGSETIDLSIRPQAKKGIGVGGLANLVKVRGTFANPSVGVDIAGAAGTAAQIGIGVMTGGLSLLAKGLFDSATMEAPCQTALRGGKAPASGTPGGQSAEQPAGGGVGGFFERLFK